MTADHNNCLSAWIGNSIVGDLQFDPANAQFSFTYRDEWMQRKGGFPLSPHIPFVRKAEHSESQVAQSVRRFFENLLPEGQALDDAARAHGLAKSNLFGLIRALGRESAGAIALLPLEETPVQQTAKKRLVTAAELHERIVQRPYYPFSVWDGKVRLSIAGYQDKLAVNRDANDANALFWWKAIWLPRIFLNPHPRMNDFRT